MRIFGLFLAAVFVMSCAPAGSLTSPQELTLEHVLNRNADARGGKAALESVENIKLSVEVTEPKFVVTGDYVATRSGLMRVDVIFEGEVVYIEAIDAEGGWQIADDGPVKEQSDIGLAILERGRVGNIYGLHEYESLGYRLNLNGIIERRGEKLIDIEVIAPDGFSMHHFLDPETYLTVSRIETSALHPDVDDTEVRQETFYLNYKRTNGVLYPTGTEKRNIDSGEVMQSTITTALEINSEIDQGYFTRPVKLESE